MHDISAIPVFVCVVEEGSFSRAAAKLDITKTAVSKRISKLEKQLGVKLLQRSTRTLNLTEAGARYFEHARHAVSAMQDAENAATQLQRTPQGLLRICVPMSFGRLYIAPIIPLFLKKYPQIKIQMDMSDLSRDVIGEGFDIALRAGDLPDSSLIARKLTSLHSVICASADYIKQHGKPKIPNDLISHNCILYTYHTSTNEWVFTKDDQENRVRIAGNFQVNNSEALCESLLQGLGIGRLPSFVAGTHINAGKLIPLLSDYTLPHKALYAVFPEKQYMPEKVRVFIDFMVDNIGGSRPHWDLWKYE